MENQPTTETREPFNKRKYNNQWDKQNTKLVSMKLNMHTDADILAHIASIPNVQGYLKQLIRDDIARHAQEETPHHEKV